eukprot:gene20051-26768_t
MFWKVAGFSQPSPIEHILDKCTPGADCQAILEELLEEDDIIQECKSMNGRLIAFLRERSTVEQLLKYMVEPTESDDPKYTYKFPFTACEVLCSEIEAVFNTLTDDPELMKLLFSLLSQPPPLSCKVAGYFGRVLAALLLRKSNELASFLQGSAELLDQLVTHIETASICDIIKHLVGADEQSHMLLSASYVEWLAGTPLIDLLLAQLTKGKSLDAQANAGWVLSAIARILPSPLAVKLTKSESIAALFGEAATPSNHLLVPTLDICIALIEPRSCRSNASSSADEQQLETEAENSEEVRENAILAIVEHLPGLVSVLNERVDKEPSEESTCGLMPPRLGRPRLKVIELFGVLVRSGCVPALLAIMQSGAIELCLKLFIAHPFSNTLHHYVDAILLDVLINESEVLIRYLFEQCHLLHWLVTLPINISPTPNPSQLDAPSAKAPIRAGYMGHATHIGSVLDTLAAQGKSNSTEDSRALGVIHSVQSVHAVKIYEYTEQHEGWPSYLQDILRPRLELENTANWDCGRPEADMPGMNSDGDDFQQDMTIEQMQEAMGMGMQQSAYNTYGETEESELPAGDPPYGMSTPEPASDVTRGPSDVTSGLDGMYLDSAPMNPESSPPNDWEDRAHDGEGSEGEEQKEAEKDEGETGGWL